MRVIRPVDDSSNDDGVIPRPGIIYRAGWGALPPKWVTPLELPVSKLIYTNTGTKECYTEQECVERIQELQRLHMVVNGYPDIQYNFMIGGDNRVYEGRGWTTMPDKDLKLRYLDGQTIDVAYIGDYDSARDPTRSMAESSLVLIQSGHTLKHLTDKVQIIPIKNDEECERFELDLNEVKAAEVKSLDDVPPKPEGQPESQ